MKKTQRWSHAIEDNIMGVYNAATDAERNYGLTWYADAHASAQMLSARYNVSVDTVCGVIAALSPGNQWGKNLIDADLLISAYVRHKKLPNVGTYGHRNIHKARRILNGELP